MDEKLAAKLDELAWWWLEYRDEMTIANVRHKWVPPTNVTPTAEPKTETAAPTSDGAHDHWSRASFRREPVRERATATIPDSTQHREAKPHPKMRDDEMLLIDAVHKTGLSDSTFYHWADEGLVDIVKHDGRNWIKREHAAEVLSLLQTTPDRYKRVAKYVGRQLRIRRFGDTARRVGTKYNRG